MRKTTVILIIIIFIILLASFFYARWYSGSVLGGDAQELTHVVASIDEDASKKLLDIVTDARRELDVPSLQVSVIIPDKGKWSCAAGWADPKEKRVATTSDIYHIGSISKMYTSAVIMKLIQDGVISLDDSLAKYVDDFPRNEEITIRHLLNHTSGIYNYTENMGYQLKTVLLRKQWSIDEMLELGKAGEAYFEPVANHYYSNTNYVLLGYIAEKVSGKPFSTLLQEEFLIPLDLDRTFFATQDNLPSDVIKGYDVSILGTGKLGIKKNMEGFQVPFETSGFTAGGIVASASDVSEFTLAMFEGEVLNEETKTMMNAFVEAPDEDVPEQTGYGLGLRRLEFGGEELRGHTGIFPGFSNVSMYSPDRGYVVTVLSNLSIVEVNYVIRRIQEEVLN